MPGSQEINHIQLKQYALEPKHQIKKYNISLYLKYQILVYLITFPWLHLNINFCPTVFIMYIVT